VQTGSFSLQNQFSIARKAALAAASGAVHKLLANACL
jgi:hypothetical protein